MGAPVDCPSPFVTSAAPATVLSPRARAAIGDVVSVGGMALPGGTSNSVEIFKSTSKTFAVAAPLTHARAGIQAIGFPSGVLKHHVLVPGGDTGSITNPTFNVFSFVVSNHLMTGEVYNHVTGLFSATGTSTASRAFYSATLLKNGTVLIAGGFPGFGPTNTAEVFDPKTNTFAATNGPMNEARALHTATLLADGRVLIAGGVTTDKGVVTNTAELYNPVTKHFTKLHGKLPGRMAGHTATLIAGCSCDQDGKVLLTGGFSSSASQSLSMEETAKRTTALYDPGTKSFSTAGLSLLHEARVFHTATPIAGGKVLIAGGMAGSLLFGGGGFVLDGVANAALHDTAEIYDPALGTMTCVNGLSGVKCHASMLSGRVGHSATLFTAGTLQGQVLIAGGSGNTKAELFDPGTGQFTATGAMKYIRSFQAAALVP